MTASASEDIPKIQGEIQYQLNKYLLGPGDVLTYQVLHEPEYSQDDILVRPDGEASFVGVGTMDVADKSVGEVQEMLEASLSHEIVHPQVMLTVKTTRPGTVYLTGAVMHPGMLQFTTSANDKSLMIQNSNTVTRTDMRLSNVLANAGGVSPDADLANVTVTRAFNGKKEKVNLWKVIKEGSIADDLWVNYGDRIDVPHGTITSDADYKVLLSSSIAPKVCSVRVIGEVRTPGVFNIDSESPYLASALAKAGGFAPQANRKMVAIRRFTDDTHFTTFMLDPNKTDYVLHPNDIVYVSENKLYTAGRFMEQAMRVLSPFEAAALTGASGAQVFGYGGWGHNTVP